MLRKALLLLLLAVLAWAGPGSSALAHDDHDDGPKAPLKAGTPPGSEVGVVELLGQQVLADAVFRDEDGKPHAVREYLTMPTIIAPVYFSCPNECSVLLGTLAQVLPQIGLTPGRDFQVLAVSFDDLDTPETAKKRKNDYMTSATASIPPDAWRFLTGDEATVKAFMDSIGFGFKRVTGSFQHSVVLVAVSQSGKIVRYLYGIRPLAFDIAMAATDAAGEKPGLSVKRAVAMCYTYDPQGRRYVFDFMRVAGIGVLTAMLLFFLFLVFGGKKRAKKDGAAPS